MMSIVFKRATAFRKLAAVSELYQHIHSSAVTRNQQISQMQPPQKTFSTEDEQEALAKLRAQFDEQSTKSLGSVPVFKRALLHGSNCAIKDQNGEFSYTRLYMGAKRLSADISSICGELTIS